jgi:hypothetical protein
MAFAAVGDVVWAAGGGPSLHREEKEEEQDGKPSFTRLDFSASVALVQSFFTDPFSLMFLPSTAESVPLVKRH